MADAPSIAHDDGPEVYQRYSDALSPQLPVPAIPSRQPDVEWDNPEHVVGYQQVGKKPRMFGLRKPKFWLLIVLAVVIVGAIVGGAVGGSLATRKVNPISNPTITQITTTIFTTPAPSPSASVSSSTSASTSTSTTASVYSVLAASAVSQLPLPACPTDTTTVFHPSHNSSASYKPECHLNFSGNDIMGLIAYTFDDCLDACDKLNYYQGSDFCVLAEFTQNMAQSVATAGLNCYLKWAVSPQTTEDNAVMSARLCRDAGCKSLAG